MEYISEDRITGRIHQVRCIKNDTLTDIGICGKCFMLLLLTEGEASFVNGNESFTAVAPCFICFDETDDPIMTRSKGMKNYVVYFNPTFLNVNMTFDLIRSDRYEKLAYDYDLFLCKPFLSHARKIPVPATFIPALCTSFEDMERELSEQSDSYWSCRSRSYFIEIIVMLERSYRLLDRLSSEDDAITERAVEFIESNFNRDIKFVDIVRASGSNRNTFSVLFKKRFNATAFEYLNAFRVEIAKKQIEFTNVPLKDIASRCGFKTVQHFSRVFKKYVGETPAAFRKRTLEERKIEFAAKK